MKVCCSLEPELVPRQTLFGPLLALQRGLAAALIGSLEKLETSNITFLYTIENATGSFISCQLLTLRRTNTGSFRDLSQLVCFQSVDITVADLERHPSIEHE
jgi:hypothetical protein